MEDKPAERPARRQAGALKHCNGCRRQEKKASPGVSSLCSWSPERWGKFVQKHRPWAWATDPRSRGLGSS